MTQRVEQRDVLVLSATRTAIGKYGGGLKDVAHIENAPYDFVDAPGMVAIMKLTCPPITSVSAGPAPL